MGDLEKVYIKSSLNSDFNQTLVRMIWDSGLKYWLKGSIISLSDVVEDDYLYEFKADGAFEIQN